jgi:glucose/arabinose dehydrogenase
LSRSPISLRKPGSTTPARSSRRAADAGRLLTGLLLISFPVAGCGGGETSTTTTPAPASTAAEQGPNGPDKQPTAATGDGEGGVKLTEIGSFEAPLYVTQPAQGSNDIFVVEQGGTIQRVSPDGEGDTYLDISDEITSGGEQGLLSMAFAPDFADSGLFYVDYTDTDGDTRVVEYEDGGSGVDESSARDVLTVSQPFSNHNGGLLLFGPDGDLYIGLGDGGSERDPDRTGLDLSTLLGKILRIDPSPGGGRPYTVPTDNPFVGQDGARPEIYSYGLRNPWRFSFDQRTGDLTIGDVGQDSEEEVDVVARGDGNGASFGWSAFEGDQRYNEDQESPDAVEPALVASHDEGNCSITGGLTVRDRDLPTLFGRYLYGDLCLGELRSFTPEPGERAADDVALGPKVESLSSFGEDADANVYATSISGPVYRLDPVR